MVEQTNVKMNMSLWEGLQIRFPDKNLNDIMKILSEKSVYIGRQMYCKKDIKECLEHKNATIQ
jgi:hypothetical protein